MELSNDPDQSRLQLRSILEHIAALSRGEKTQLLPSDTATLVKNYQEPATISSALQPSNNTSQLACIDTERDRQDVSDFLEEVREHLDSADQELLSAESEEDNVESLNSLFRSFHSIKGLAGFFGAEVTKSIAHESESLLDKVRNNDLVLTSDRVDIIFSAIDLLRGQVSGISNWISEGATPEAPNDLERYLHNVQQALLDEEQPRAEITGTVAVDTLTKSLVNTGTITSDELERTLTKHNLNPDLADPQEIAKAVVQEGLASARAVGNAIREAKNSGAAIRESIKVDAGRLDRLVDMIGELVIAQSMVMEIADQYRGDDNNLLAQLAQMNKITRQVQELGTSLRMVAIGPTFQRMARLARDLSRQLNKPLDLVYEGEDTDLDKTVVDRIGDPLVHMVRNSIDHGLENSSEERQLAGKPERGRITLRAYHQGGKVIIDIEDDGQGLNRDKILKRAIDRGILPENSQPTDQEIWALIFAPGFSTAEVVSDISGRGVGMDVVRRSIESLGGQVNIQSSPGSGTLFSIQLPLTLAVIDGMAIRVGNERYFVPTQAIVTSCRPHPSSVISVTGKGEMLQLHGDLMPLFRMSQLFTIEGAEEDPSQALAMVLENGDERVAFLVDELLGQQQVVVKPLGSVLGELPGISGGAIMPDGTVGLIPATSMIRPTV
ncbi:MAG: chemotaxis protein CheA [Sphaerospermopsis sp. SIO1G2]|nr:chemotaxis protein CheA [Sphaerospermopsis sp. SIO1G2]